MSDGGEKGRERESIRTQIHRVTVYEEREGERICLN